MYVGDWIIPRTARFSRFPLMLLVPPLLVLSPLLLPSAGLAQTDVTVGGDAFLGTDYVWRGIERRNGWVLQPYAYVSLGFGATLVTAGWWTNVERASADVEDPQDVGLGRRWFGENDVWLEVSSRIGSVGAVAGFVRYLFARPESFAAARLFDTSELYARLWLNAGSLVPEVSVWYDVDRIDGAYMETGADFRVPTLPSRSPIFTLYLSARAAWSLGQELAKRPSSRAYFVDGGLTHVDLGFRLMVGDPSSYLTLEGHALLGVDSPLDFPGAEGVSGRGSTVWWFGLTASRSAVVAVF